jgi:AAA15 family ATPase/GTPase
LSGQTFTAVNTNTGSAMKISKIQMKSFRRFTDTTIENIPESARLIMIAGPNGSGKSSFFDALSTWKTLQTGRLNWDPSYHHKATPSPAEGLNRSNYSNNITLEFHDFKSLIRN